ncbi:hypothetical protein TIFTF001_030223 [Ficus carica]|uniref:Uncharacterized protein n=1 Tax=Ficus carica TaxID=3494 RepID=A0AA88J4L2_FICCA|nr:hypothetical protein TIFTF001_030223 [Ficus carica]
MPMNSGRAGGSCSPEGKAVEAASSQPNRDSIATHSLPGPNLATFVADGVPIMASELRPTSEDLSPHPILSSSSSPSTASSTEPSRCGNRAGDGD